MQSLARKIVDLLGITSKGQATMANSLPIAIASNQSAVPVSGGLTNAELRASAVPVSGGLTNAELRASAVPVSGGLTNAELRATPVPVYAALSGTKGQSKISTVTGTGVLPVPASPQSDRNAIRIKNQHSTDNIYLKINVSGGAATGWLLRPYEEVYFPINDEDIVYAHPESSNVSLGVIEEL